MSGIPEEIKLPFTWSWVRCQDVVDVRDGTHDTPTKRNFGIPLITSKNLTPEGLNFSDITYISEEDHQNIEKRSAVDDGDVLFAMIGTIGTPVIVKKDRQFSIKNVALFKLNKSLYYPPFFKELLNTSIIRKQLARNTKGGNQKFVSLSVLREMLIPLPPLEEQRRIAEILDRAQSLISKRREAIGQLDTLTQAIFIEMFGDVVKNQKNWKTDRMENLMRIRRGGSPRPIEKYLGGDINWIKIGDGTKGSDIYLESCDVKITRDGLSKTVFLKKGSLIFANCGVSLGFARILKIDGCIHDGWLSFDDIDEIKLDKLFLLKAINSITNHFRAIAPDGTQPNLNTGLMKNFLMILPPLPLQQEFAQRVEAVEKLKASHRASLSELDALFASLQHRAFRGEL